MTTAALEINLAFVLRLTCDRATGQWHIRLKPINGQEVRLFHDVETALLYLETIMQKAQP